MYNYHDLNNKYHSKYASNYHSEKKDVKKEDILKTPKCISYEKVEARLKEAIKRLEKCRFLWQRSEGIRMIKSIIENTKDGESKINDIFEKIRNVLTHFSDDPDEVISQKAQNALKMLNEKQIKIQQEKETKQKNEIKEINEKNDMANNKIEEGR